MKIYKYNLSIPDGETVLIPKGAVLLDVQNQNNQLMLWAQVDPAAEPIPYLFKIYETGHEMDEVKSHRYLATVQLGLYVWHVFEVL